LVQKKKDAEEITKKAEQGLETLEKDDASLSDILTLAK